MVIAQLRVFAFVIKGGTAIFVKNLNAIQMFIVLVMVFANMVFAIVLEIDGVIVVKNKLPKLFQIHCAIVHLLLLHLYNQALI